MKVTKYGQSCILMETKGKRILIDPGIYDYDDSLLNNGWNNIDLILVTHKDKDHCNDEAIKKIIERDSCKIYATKETKEHHQEIPLEIIKEGDIFDFENIKIEVVKAIHGYTPSFRGRETNEGVGYIVDDGEKRLYSVGDSICFRNDYKCDVIFVPVCNHGIVMGPYEAGMFAKETGAELIIPYHYDSPKYPGDLNKVKEEFDKQELNYKILKKRESIEI